MRATSLVKPSASESPSRSAQEPGEEALTPAVLIRPIEARDDAIVGSIIRQVMTEFGAVGCNFSISDPEVDAMHSAYPAPKAAFFVVEKGGRVLGCGGMGPLLEGPEDVCELRKMYFLPELRGTGLGTELLSVILDAAREAGYRRCYLETLGTMSAAHRLYSKHGFEPIAEPLGNTGHSGCNAWMIREL
jgi:putative acetyltransferase